MQRRKSAIRSPVSLDANGPKPPLADVLNAAQQRHQTGHSRTTQHSWLGKPRSAFCANVAYE